MACSWPSAPKASPRWPTRSPSATRPKRIAGCQIPPAAGLVRVLYGELERIANHLDVAVRLADAARLAVATARFALHKEHVLRLVSRMCGSRFGRGVVVPGGVSAPPRIGPAEIGAELRRLEPKITADAAALMATSSLLDRLRGPARCPVSGPGSTGRSAPSGRRPGSPTTTAWAVPTTRTRRSAYSRAARTPPGTRWPGCASAGRRWKRPSACSGWPPLFLPNDRLSPSESGVTRPMAGPRAGLRHPQGEVLYDLTVAGGRVARCHPRSASFHNLVLMHEVFAGDILTDFPFIEASFGLSIAGVAL